MYEEKQIKLLAAFIGKHSKPNCEVILVDPGRGSKSKLSSKMIEQGFNSTHIKPVHTNYLEKDFKGHILKFERLV